MCGNNCGHNPASSAAISSATFSLLTVVLAILAAIVPQYSIVFNNSTVAPILFYLTGVRGTIVCTSAFSGSCNQASALIPYSVLASDPFLSTSPGLSAAFRNANSAGPAVIAFYVVAIIALLLHSVSTIMFACNSRAKTSTALPCPALFTLPAFGISFASVGFVCFLLAAAITWGVFGDMFKIYVGDDTVGFLKASPGAGLAATGFIFAIVALSCELVSKLCKDMKTLAAPVFNQPTTIIVTNSALGGGATIIQQQQQQQQGGFSSGFPLAVEAKAAPPLITQQPQTQWKAQTNGSDTCELYIVLGLRLSF